MGGGGERKGGRKGGEEERGGGSPQQVLDPHFFILEPPLPIINDQSLRRVHLKGVPRFPHISSAAARLPNAIQFML